MTKYSIDHKTEFLVNICLSHQEILAGLKVKYIWQTCRTLY